MPADRDATAAVGLEVHVQLDVPRKLFGPARRADPDEPPNRALDAVSLGLPGSLPVLDPAAVRQAARLALALQYDLHLRSEWDRKHYFYPDLPKGYQITQARRPLATDGRLAFTDDAGARVIVPLLRLHLEEDAGKSSHVGADETLVDFNRASVALVELVTAPVLRSGADARRFLKQLRATIVAVGASTARLERGELRVDANVSVAACGQTGVRVELKNLNSFRFVELAIRYEIERQTARIAEGAPVHGETRRWDARARRTVPLRTKERHEEYRYLPEPDLPEVVLEPAEIERWRATLPELPDARADRYRRAGVASDVAEVMATDPELAALLEPALAEAPELAGEVAKLVVGPVCGHRPEDRTLGEFPAATLVTLARRQAAGALSSTQARQVVADVWHRGESAVAELPAAMDDDRDLARIVQEVLDRHPEPVARYRSGKLGVLGFLIGQVMQATAGRARPERARALLLARIETTP